MRIFIIFFIVIFIILATLMSIGQYNDFGKINFFVSIKFSFPLSCLGAGIAAIFIGTFKKLETQSPWVKCSEYRNIDELVLKDELSNIRRKRLLIFVMIVMWLPFGALLMVLNMPIIAFVYMVFMVIIGKFISFTRCPRCNYYFFYRSEPGAVGDIGNDKLNLIFGIGYRNPFSNKCLNCGLELKRCSNKTQ